jgi:hypothetical protein
MEFSKTLYQSRSPICLGVFGIEFVALLEGYLGFMG